MQRWARALLSEKVRLEGGRLKTRDDRAQLLPACQFPVQLTKDMLEEHMEILVFGGLETAAK